MNAALLTFTLTGIASIVRDDSKRWRLGSGVSKAKRTDNRFLKGELPRKNNAISVYSI